jgi:hypothetical protein
MDEERRLVEVQLQQWVPQTTTIVVSVPAGWTDAEIKARLSDMYGEYDASAHAWCDQEDYDPRAGHHELTGEADDPKDTPDLVYPPTEDDDADVTDADQS